MHCALPIPETARQRQWPSRPLTRAPRWCSVDLRDGNQALPRPMTPEQKRTYFQLLVSIGFKEIEIGFPAASQDEWDFCRTLIETNDIPSDVTISVLTQARPHIIERTMQSLRGISCAVVHLYAATSDLFQKYVLHQCRDENRRMVLDAVQQIKELAQAHGLNVGLEFSPEEFTDSDVAYVAALCDDVVEAWEYGRDNDVFPRVIINLPETVERALPSFYADRIEAFCATAKHRDRMVISLHAHNDMGSAVADTELALQAGAERVEGTLFGHGERAGNVDLVTLALNLAYLGLDTGLDFSQLETIAGCVSDLTGLPIPMRQPYAGELAFTAFSGSHQDAINKGYAQMESIQEDFHGWKMPYFHVPPEMIGRQFQQFIRITSQSGKGGIGHVLHQAYGVDLPHEFLSELMQAMQETMDADEREYTPAEVWTVLLKVFVCLDGPIVLKNFWPRPDMTNPNQIHSEVHVVFHGKPYVLNSTGEGPVAAFADAIRQLPIPSFLLASYEEKALGVSVHASSITYVKVKDAQGRIIRGIGLDNNIVQGAVQAIVSALNKLMNQ